MSSTAIFVNVELALRAEIASDNTIIATLVPVITVAPALVVSNGIIVRAHQATPAQDVTLTLMNVCRGNATITVRKSV